MDDDFVQSMGICYVYYFHWAILANRAGGVGLIFGTPEGSNFYSVPRMYLVPEELAFSTYKVITVHSRTISHMMEEAATHGSEVWGTVDSFAT